MKLHNNSKIRKCARDSFISTIVKNWFHNFLKFLPILKLLKDKVRGEFVVIFVFALKGRDGMLDKKTLYLGYRQTPANRRTKITWIFPWSR